jgi:hypothetical protein
MSMLLMLSPASHAATTVSADGFFVDVDLEDILAGTLIGDVGANRHQTFENLGDFGDPLLGNGLWTTTDIGFVITAENNSGTDTFVALYDSEQRQYYTDGTFNTPTRVFDNVGGVAGRDDSSSGNAATGEDPDLERDDDGDGQWEAGNIALTTNVGNVMIVQENLNNTERAQGHTHFVQGQDVGNNHAPDDLVGGEILITFESDLTQYVFTWVDLETPNEVSVTFGGLEDSNGNAVAGTIEVFFDDLETGGAYDQAANWGDRHINEIVFGTIEDDNTDLDAGNNTHEAFLAINSGLSADVVSFNTVLFDTNADGGGGGNSGGVGLFAFRLREPVTVVPEPSTYVTGALLVGLVALGVWHRRKLKTLP